MVNLFGKYEYNIARDELDWIMSLEEGEDKHTELKYYWIRQRSENPAPGARFCFRFNTNSRDYKGLWDVNLI